MRAGPSNQAGRLGSRATLAWLSLCVAGATLLQGLAAAPEPSGLVTLSIVGTSDLHGVALPGNGLGGLPLLAGYVNNLRAARASDGGAVLLIDSGDTFQGDIETNLSEGALVVDAYNAMGYTAEAIGNHDFDYGTVDSPTGRELPGDLRGAIKARAAQARYPFLAANLIDEATGRLIEWRNVRPSVIVPAAGLKVGMIGVMTIDAMRSTLAANVRGLQVAPLVPTITAEAARLRAAGADLVIVASHAGGRCDRFDDPDDLSSCDADSEIFRVARSLPQGTVDVIAAGHTHSALAHRVNGIAIIQPYSRGQAFGRADIVFDRKTRSVARVQLFAPHSLCVRQDPRTANCVPAATEPAVPTEYEGRPVTSDTRIVQAMAPALERVHRLQAMPLGVSLEVPIRRGGELGSPLGSIFADAIRDAVPGVDAAVINNATRLWADIPGGALTFGQIYGLFPFDNRIVRINLTGGDLRRWFADEIRQGRRNALGISGLGVRAGCDADRMQVDLLRQGGRPIADGDRLVVATIGAPTISGGVAVAAFLGVDPADSAPVVREVVEDWFRQPAHVSLAQLENAGQRLSIGSSLASCDHH